MPYTSNPHMPQVRMDAVKMVRKGHSMRSVALHFGYNVSTISKWVTRAPDDGRMTIPTQSSRPHTQPNALPQSTIDLILELRLKRHRCAEVVHYQINQMGISVSLSSVKRVLKRAGVLREKSKWKKYHHPIPRPVAAYPGALVQLDTIHIQPFQTKERFYIYTLIDVYSRWAHAWVSEKLSAGITVSFLRQAQIQSTFEFTMLQTDHGPEFSKWFTSHAGIPHRHSRVRKPNDNAHLERFNRTIKEECLYYIKQEPQEYQQSIDDWLPYYNNEREHLSLDFLVPSQVLPSS
ncbi:MAG: integrase core domain-containing protein [bacterium]|nr:integrase core domain-containing protein [bacterium]